MGWLSVYLGALYSKDLWISSQSQVQQGKGGNVSIQGIHWSTEAMQREEKEDM